MKPAWRKIYRLLLSLILLAAALYLSQSDESHSVAQNDFQVRRVIDGDTIEVINADQISKVRLIGVNTPESVDPRRPVECFGKEAAAFVAELLTGQTVALIADDTQADSDKYGRLLRYVRLSDGRLLNQLIIEEGYGYEYTYDRPYQEQAAFRQAQLMAQAAGRGLWSENTCQTPSN